MKAGKYSERHQAQGLRPEARETRNEAPGPRHQALGFMPFALCPFGRKALILSLSMLIFVSPAYGGGFAVQRTVNGYTFEISMDRNPSVSPRNDLRIAIKDPLGRYVANAAVMVNYYMPPMPSMAPMNYKVKAETRSNEYRVAMNLIMAGPWIIAVNTNVAGKNLRITVPIDVR